MRKILVVSSSPVERKIVSQMLQEAKYFVETARNGKELTDALKKKNWDLIILDIKVLKQEGLNLIKETLKLKPIRVLIITDKENIDLAEEALKAGALDFIEKKGSVATTLNQIKKELLEKVQQLLKVPKFEVLTGKTLKKKKEENSSKKIFLEPSEDMKYILIGSSTGGPGHIEEIARALPKDYPYPICVVQHMPTNFTKKFAERLDSISKVKVVEASNGEELTPGKMIIGKGGWHLHFMRRPGDNKVVCKLVPNTSKRFFVPSVDEMYFSALKVLNPENVVAILLTGIGDDGADGMVALKKAGAYTIAESEETAAVYGMPKEAYLRGGTVEVLPFPKIVERILELGESNGI